VAGLRRHPFGAKNRKETENFNRRRLTKLPGAQAPVARVRYDDEERVFRSNGHRPG